MFGEGHGKSRGEKSRQEAGATAWAKEGSLDDRVAAAKQE